MNERNPILCDDFKKIKGKINPIKKPEFTEKNLKTKNQKKVEEKQVDYRSRRNETDYEESTQFG